MKRLAAMGRPPLIAALDAALGRGGASELDGAVPSAVWRAALAGPAAEFLARPGKQLRALVVRAGWALGAAHRADDAREDGDAPAVARDRLALVIELLHAGSLIIDDIEDDSDERRGMPTLHRVVGVPLAINTGSWMYFWAQAELARLGLSPARELAAHRAMAAALVRCHQGQALDLATTIGALAADDVPAVVAATTRLKTATLCELAAELGALGAGGDAASIAAARQFASALGTGLQMLDDLGSLACSARRAKGREDLRGGCPTWPWAWLVEHAPSAWPALARRARDAAEACEATLDALADDLVAHVEDAGRACIRRTLDGALAALATVPHHHEVSQLVAAELRRMEESYG